MEEWKDIDGYNGLYQISNLGRVKSLLSNTILKPNHDSYGYVRVNLYKDKKSKIHKIHRLVAKAFLPDYSDELEVNHKNEIKDDNGLSNLEMCDRQYNISYGNRTRKYYKPIIQETLEGEFIREWKSLKSVNEELGYNTGAISQCLKGYKQSHNGKIYSVHHAYGFLWKYKQI